MKRLFSILLFMILLVVPTIAHAQDDDSDTCFVSSSNSVNLRSGPGTGFTAVDKLPTSEPVRVQAQATGDDGFVWWNLADGNWVRSDVVQETGGCSQLATNDSRVFYTAALDASDPAEQLDNLNDALEIDPGYADAYRLRGDLYFNDGDYEAALVDYDQAIELGMVDIATVNQRGRTFYALGMYADALDDFDWLVEEDSNNAVYYNNRGAAYMGLGDFENAANDFRRSLAFDPNYALAYVNRAELNAQQGNTDAAFEDFNRALGISADLPGALLGRGALYLETDNVAAAGNDLTNYFAMIGETLDGGELIADEATTLAIDEGDSFTLSFDAVAGDVVSIEVMSEDVDSLLVLIGPDGNVIAFNDDSNDGVDASVSALEIAEDGTYTLIVGHAMGRSSGEVDVLLTFE